MVAVLGFAGGLLHVAQSRPVQGPAVPWSGRGAARHGHARDGPPGGLLKKMPWTAGDVPGRFGGNCGPAAAERVRQRVADLPRPLQGVVAPGSRGPAAAVAVVGGLALIGGLAAACFTKAFGMVFLGEPRTGRPRRPTRFRRRCWCRCVRLALGCVADRPSGPPLVLRGARRRWPCRRAAARSRGAFLVGHATGSSSGHRSWCGGALAVVWRAASCGRLRLLPGGQSRRGDLGLRLRCADGAHAVHRSSFAQPLVGHVSPFLRHAAHGHRCRRPFPAEAEFSSHTPDVRRGRSDPLPGVGSGCCPACAGSSTGGSSSTCSTCRGPCWSCWSGRMGMTHDHSATVFQPRRAAGRSRRCCPGSSTASRPSSPGARAAAAASRTTTLRSCSRKGAVYSRTTSWVFRVGPVVGLAAAVSAWLVASLGRRPTARIFDGDLVLFAALLGLDAVRHHPGRPGHRLRLRGHGREPGGWFSALAEPALLLALARSSRMPRQPLLSGMLAARPGRRAGGPRPPRPGRGVPLVRRVPRRELRASPWMTRTRTWSSR